MKSIICIDKDKNPYEVPTSDLIWRPSTYAIIIQDARILLVPQWDGYDLPGGGIELGETIEEWLIREVKEETGMDVIAWDLVDCKTSFFNTQAPTDNFIQSVMLYYTAYITGGELSVAGFDEEEKSYARMAEWVPLAELQNINFKSSVEILPIIQKVI